MLEQKTEMRRITIGPEANEKLGGAGIVRYVAHCNANGEEVLAKVKSLLICVDEASLNGWLPDEVWLKKLPLWFTQACAVSLTKDQADARLAQWRRLTPEQQAKAERDQQWSLDNWLWWMTPNQRMWFWWDVNVLSPSKIAVAVEATEWPFGWGALRWLFKAAGADSLEAEE